MKLKLLIFTLLCAVMSWGQVTTIAIQDFESTPATPTWSYTNSGGGVSNTNTGTPNNQRIRNGLRSFQINNTTSALTFDNINVSGYNSVSVIIRVSSISVTTGNGADAADFLRAFVKLDAGSFLTNTQANANIAVNGNSNARWGYNATGVSTNVGTNVVVAGTSGTNTGTIYSTLTINIPNGTSIVGLRLNVLNDDANEIWCIDDVEIIGTPASTNTITTDTAITGSPFCVSASTGASVSVPFTSVGTFNAGNVYTAQLSSASGSFASPVSIGTVASTANSGTITATIPAGTAAGTGYRIRVVSNNPVVTGTDNTVNLTVQVPAAITTQPSTTVQNLCQGSAATALSVTATGTTLTYQWYSNTTATTSGGTPVGTNSNSYIPVTTSTGTLYYYCVVSGVCGASITSNVSGAVVVNSIPADPIGSITVSANPSCGPATLSYPAGYYWQTTASGTSSANPTSSNYTLNATGTVYVRAYNGSCWSSSSINTGLITINTPVNITTHPTNKTIPDGTTTTFAVTATGTGLTYQWQVDTGSGFTNLANGAPYSGVTAPTMTITGATLAMSGYSYRCIVSGAVPCTSVISNGAILTVNPVPEIDVTGNGESIVDGATTTGAVSFINNTNFGAALVNSGTIVKTFTIRNLGAGNLTVNSITSSYTAMFVVSGFTGPVTILPGDFITFQVTFAPTSIGVKFTTIAINNNDSNEGIYEFRIEGEGVSTSAPEINVYGNNNNILDNSTTFTLTNNTDFGSELVGVGVTKTFTIFNQGTADLTLGAITINGANASDFVVTTSPAPTVAAGASTTFSVTFTPSALGFRNAEISIVNNDSNENPYNFLIRGTGAEPTITVTPATLTALNYNEGSGPSASGSFVVSGQLLTSNLVVTAPTNYEISLAVASGFGSSITLVPVSRNITTTIYVRLKAGLSAGLYNSEVIDVTSIGATAKTVTCSGRVYPPTPVNDLCSNAIELFTNQPPVLGTLISSSASSFDTSKEDVWYKITPNCSINYSFVVSNFTGNMDIALYGTNCPTVISSLSSSTGTLSSSETINHILTAGTTYYLRVYASSVDAETSDFTVEVTSGALLLTNQGSPAAASVSAGTPNYVVMGFTLDPQCADNYGVSTVTLIKAATSTVVSSDISNFRIFRDVNQNGVIDATDISISSSGIPLANSMLFTLNGQSNVSGSKSYLLVADISPLAIAGRTIKVDLNPVSNIVTTIPISGSATGNVQTIVAQSCTPAVIGSISPAFGPAGTEVTITALSGNLTGATATFNGLTATVISSSATQLVVKVPFGATSGDLVISDAQPCYTGAYFEVISEVITDCEGSITDLIIYEIFDEEFGSGGTIVLYNGTTTPKDLSDYELFRDADDNSSTSSFANFMSVSAPYVGLTGVLLPGQVAILKVTGSDCGPATTNNGQLSGGFNAYDEFQLRLKSTGTVIDHVVAPTSKGYYLQRNPGSYTANPVYVPTDWSYTDMDVDVNGDNECVTMGIPPTSIGRSPIITSQPSNVSAICGTLPAVLSVTAVEGYAGGRSLTYQWFYVAPGDTTWIAVTDGGLYSGATTNSLTISDVNPILGYQFYCQVKEDSATCYIATEAIKLTNLSPTTWDGTSWSDGTPTLLKPAVINGNYDTSLNGNIEACSLTVNPGFTARVTTGMYFNIQNEVTVLSGANLIINDDGSLVQINDASVNSGNIRYERTANEIHLSDYVYWSSPVQNFLVRNISPTTPAYYHWKWGTTAPNYNNGEGNWVAAYNDTMIPGKGYIVRAPNGFSNTLTQPWNVAFTGVPNNGLITPQVLRGTNRNLGTVGPDGSIRSRYGDNFNLIGNPYPSAISINAFLMENPFLDGFVNVWTHGSLPSVLNPDHFYDDYDANYTPNDYITINSVGVHSGPNAISYIAGGQGFFVEISEDTPDNNPVDTTVTFRNYMRSKTYHNHEFFRPSREESNSVPALSQSKNRIWLDLVGPTNVSHRILVGYVAGATNQRDRMYDAVVGYGSGQSFYSIIDNDIFKIQGKSLPFDVNDRIPLGVKVGTTGVHQIAIAYKDGLFLGNQNIYLEDLHLGVIHDLRATPYSFTASTGIINNRFVLRYTDVTLSNPDIQNNSDVYISTSEVIGIDAVNYQIESIQIHNILGQLLFHKRQVNSGSFQISDLQKNNVPLIVQVTLDNGVTITKKIIY